MTYPDGIRTTPLSKTAPSQWAQVSELGFGCAAIGGRTSPRDSLAALGLACDAGITLYDTARSYGYGEAEKIVGTFLRPRRDSVVLCTKFGILPARQGGWKQKLKPAARTVLRLFPGLRGAVRSQASDQFLGGQFSVDILTSSFETSLRELHTDYVDILLMHAAPESVLHQEDLLEAMEHLVASGKVRLAGISADQPVISSYFSQRPKVLQTAQFAVNLATLAFTAETQRHSDLLLVGNHPFGGPSGAAEGKAAIASLAASTTLPSSLREKLDHNDPQVFPELVLNAILRGTGIAAVIPAMMQPHHIRSNIRAVTNCRFTTDELHLLRESLMSTPLSASRCLRLREYPSASGL